MKDNYEHIYHASNERLAEILEANADFEAKFVANDTLPKELERDVLPTDQWVMALREAARRLRSKPRAMFYSEAFE